MKTGMTSSLRCSALLFVVLLTGCRHEDRVVAEIFSPDGKYKLQLRQCSTYEGGRQTQATLLTADRSEACRSFVHGLAGFGAPYDHTKLRVRWLSNDRLEVSHPEFPPGTFPLSTNYSSAYGKSGIRLVFPK